MINEGLECKGWAALSPGEKLVEYKFKRDSLGPFDCYMDVINTGICHSDIHLLDGDWGPMASFPKPQVCGHEIVGKITKVGDMVSDLSCDDVVGVGWQQSSCHQCKLCLDGEENLCDKRKLTCCRGGQGGFADKFRCDSRLCFKIPDGLDLKVVGPLMCAGITVYSPLRKYAKPGCTVGVLGIGGLGHLAIKFARAMGCSVTAFSRSEAKRSEAISFGADTYVATNNGWTKPIQPSLDVLIITITKSVDWKPYMDMMLPNGVMVFVGAITDKPLPLQIFGPFIAKQLVLVGSGIGGSIDMKEMLKFVSSNKETLPIVETMPMNEINNAIERVKTGNVRFRMVVEN